MRHADWLVEAENGLKTSDGVEVKIYDLNHTNDDEILSSWAKHFRNHYCSDNDIDNLRNGTGLSKLEYLLKNKFPDEKIKPGPSIRAGDFGEILVADYLEYLLKYWVPRTRFDRKTIKNESTKGSDVLAFKLINEQESSDDILAIFEVKTQMSKTKNKNRLQDAIDGSIKDSVRKAESLNAVKQRLMDRGESENAMKIGRFQNTVDKPYKEISGAAVLFSNDIYEESVISSSNAAKHPNKMNLSLIIIRGKDFMELVHNLYQRAANEA